MASKIAALQGKEPQTIIPNHKRLGLGTTNLISSMTTKPSDLIAIANPELAKKLAEQNQKQKPSSKTAEADSTDTAADEESIRSAHKTYRQEVWRAVLTLNVLRYFFALALILMSLTIHSVPGFQPFRAFTHPDLFTACASVLLLSAAAFTLLTKNRNLPLRIILITQFFIDTVVAGLLVHATGSIASGFTLMFLIVVTTGSVVLSRREALALAAGSIMVIFFEHFYSVLTVESGIDWRFDALAMYGILLMFMAFAISSLARMVRHAELRSYVPGNESIDEFLRREEINALKSALAATQGNKTEAAKLLGMTFRSFRYKLSKYEIS